MIKEVKQFLKNSKIKNKVKKQLPNYHPITGQRLDWEILLYRTSNKYNTITGKQIGGKLQLSINQKAPTCCVIDDNCYKFNWKTKKIERIQCASWR